MRLRADKAKRLSRRAANIGGVLAILCAPLVVFAAPAAAQSTFADHVWKFVSGATNTIDFNKGGSKIFDNGDLTVQTDDQLNLNAPTTVKVSHDLTVSHVLNLWRNGTNIGGSKIFENGNLHVATDDRLYLDAPNFVQVSNKLNVGSDLTVAGNITSTGGVFTGDGSGLTNLNVSVDNLDSLTLDSPEVDFSGNLYTGGWFEAGGTGYFDNGIESYDGITMNADYRHAQLYLANDGDLVVDGNSTLGSSKWDSVTVNGRLYGNDGDPVTVGRSSDNSGFKVWGDTDLRGDLSVGGWGVGNNDAVFNVDLNCSYSGESSAGCITLGSVQDDSNIFVNGRLYGAYDGDGGYLPVTIGHHYDADNSGLLVWGQSSLAGGAQVGMPFDYEDLTVYGDSYLNGSLSINNGNSLYFNDGQWQQYVNSDTQNLVLHNDNSGTDVFQVSEDGNVTITGESRHATLDLANDGDLYVEGNTTLGSSKWDSVTVNGRLYGEEGDAVTVGRYTSENDFKVWGNTDLRGDLSVGGWGTLGNTTNFSVSNDCSYDGEGESGGCITLGGDNYEAVVTVNGRLYGGSGYPLTIGHHDDYSNSGLLVWGHTSLAGGATVGMPWDNEDLTVDGNITMNASGRHATLDLSNDGDLNVEGNTTLGSSSWDELDVNAEAYFNSYAEFDNETDFYNDMYLEDGSFYVEGGNIEVLGGHGIDISGGGNLTVSGTATFANASVDNLVVNNSTTWGGTVVYNGATTYNGASTYNSSATFNGAITGGAATLSGTFTVTGAPVNFSGASSLRVPVVPTAISDNTTVCSTTGLVTFSTNDNHFYGCDGTHWQIFDN
jgi:hypothetical protein